jgi:16S rRNA (guanine527-N7)-methyltransferase
MTDNEVINDSLAAALARHGIELPDDAIQVLDRYARLLWNWNEKLNLTRHTTYEKFVARDIVDCTWLEKFIDSGDRVLDVGTGGGVPGVVLAILRPDLQVTLCESMAKKARVVEAIVRELGLPIEAHHARAEDLLATRQFDTLVARAVAPLAKILTWFGPHWDMFHRLLLIKGPAWIEERGEARHRGLLHDLTLRKLAAYPLPGTESESVVLLIRPRDAEES